MAVVYHFVNGDKIERAMARTKDAQDALGKHAYLRASRAYGYLSKHRHDGHARIEIEKGDIDRYVILSDERGLGAAMSIEYGRQGRAMSDTESENTMEGLFILHRAFGIDH